MAGDGQTHTDTNGLLGAYKGLEHVVLDFRIDAVALVDYFESNRIGIVGQIDPNDYGLLG